MKPRPGGDFAWREAPAGALAFERDGIVCVVNVDAEPFALPPGELLLASEPGVRGELPRSTATWIREE